MNNRNRTINKNNNSGIPGVWFKPNHGVAGSWIAIARINNKCVSKTFGCLRRGYENAKNLAIEWRKKHEEKCGITVRNN